MVLLRARSRRGFTLLELVLVIAVTTMITTAVATLLHAMMRHQSAASQQLKTGSVLTQLGERLRKDVQLAESADIGDGVLFLRQPKQGEVVWRQLGDFIVRDDDTFGDLRRDHYEMIPGRQCEFRLLASGGCQLVELTIGGSEVVGDDGSVQSSSLPSVMGNDGMKFWAELGRDRRWQTQRVDDDGETAATKEETSE